MKSARLAAYFCAVAGLLTPHFETRGNEHHSTTTSRPAASAPATGPTTGQIGFVEEKYDNGQLKSHYSLDLKGAKSGSYTLYSEDGKRTERGTYKNGELDGTRQVYYANGNVKLREEYRKGRLEGALSEHDEKGVAVRAAQFRAGAPINDRTSVEGVLVYPRSTAMIVAELERIRKLKIETVRAATPIPEHDGGNDSDADREAAVRRLMEYRYLSYVPYEDLKLDALYCAHDEAAVGLLAAIKKLDHTPANPGWPEDRFKFAYAGTSHSNLYVGGGGANCAASVNAYMDDSDASNIDRLGHRRWALNPHMGKVGFASYKGYGAMWSMDNSRKIVPRYEFIACPGPGFYPRTHFGTRRAWSLSLSESAYLPPPAKGIKVTITPAQVHIDENKIVQMGKPMDLDYDAVNFVGYGGSNCIIFRPVGLKMDSGNGYLVEVSGLKTNSGKATSIRYYVEFFKPEEEQGNGR